MLRDLLGGWLEEIIWDFVKLLNDWLVDLIDVSLNAQSYMEDKLNINGINFSAINDIILKYAIALLILKFIFKGFNIYILQMDGDSDMDPVTILTGLFEAVIVSLTFYGLYPHIIGVFKEFTKEILKAMGNAGGVQIIKDPIVSTLISREGITLFLIVIYFVLAAWVYIKLIINGAELLILRLIVPILSVGLMDSDGGAFKVAGKKFLQMAFTCTLTIVLLRISLAFFISLHPIWAIAYAILSILSPKLLQEYLYIKQGGGMSTKIYAASAIMRLFK